MAARLIILGGAPEQENLNWDEHELEFTLSSPLKRFLGEQPPPSSKAAASTHSHSKWRRLVPNGPTTTNVRYDDSPEKPQTQFLLFGGHDDESQERTDFLQHSLAFLNELDSSQIVASQPTGYDEQTTFTTSTSLSFSESLVSVEPTNYSIAFERDTDVPRNLPPLNMTGAVTDLKRIPPASHLHRIHPQTMTTNILAAIIKVQPTRTVRLRRRNAEMDLIELIIGDETRAGFSVSFWLNPLDSQPQDQKQQRDAAESDEIRRTLNALRSGDVVFVQNVALNVWRNQVYGQSLSRRFARNSTAVVVIGNSTTASTVSGTLRAKAERVLAWSEEFVGVPVVRGGARGRSVDVAKEELPPDTQ